MKIRNWVLILIALMFIAPLSSAAIFDLGDSGWAMVVDPQTQAVGEVSIPYVFGVVRDAVVIEIDKTFNKWPNDYGIFTPIVVEFMKVSETAVSKIVINDEYIVNNTGHVWTDFHMSLQVTSKKEAGFIPNQIHGGQLEQVWYDQEFGYDELPTQLNFLDVVGGGVDYMPAGNDVFRPGYIAGDIIIQTNPELQVGDRILLKEVPTMIPEPTTIALMALGFLPTVLKRKRSA